MYFGDYNTLDIKVSKPGYLTYEEKNFFAFHRGRGDESEHYETLLKGESIRYDHKTPIKVELLRMPTTSAEHRTFEVKRQEQELLKAVKYGDAETVRSLLQAGASANATDIYGIPAILLAAIIGNAETIKALLAAGADVRSKNKPGRKALLYYLYSTPGFEIELAQSLIAAGADLNAKLYDGETMRSVAKGIGNEELINLLKRAKSKPK
jgi:ankyrin repeat protein